MSEIALGQPVPPLSLLLTGNRTANLSDFRGNPLVLYFYPKAGTPGCTLEGRDFSAAAEEFHRHSAVILGASRDGLKAQENFKAKQGFPFDLVSDKEETLCNLFEVIKLKNMYGKQVRGIERSTFLIDSGGRLRQAWRKVKVQGHVEEVLQALKALNSE